MRPGKLVPLRDMPCMALDIQVSHRGKLVYHTERVSACVHSGGWRYMQPAVRRT